MYLRYTLLLYIIMIEPGGLGLDKMAEPLATQVVVIMIVHVRVCLGYMEGTSLINKYHSLAVRLKSLVVQN